MSMREKSQFATINQVSREQLTKLISQAGKPKTSKPIARRFNDTRALLHV
jgi:16S rRNA C1402 N4-methylase RsmH